MRRARRIVIRDAVAERTERWLDSQWLRCSCWAVIVLAALYFGAGFVMSGLFRDLVAAMAR